MGIYELQTCKICGKRIGSRGQAGHALMHVRKKEAVITNLTKIQVIFNLPYEFEIAPDTQLRQGA